MTVHANDDTTTVSPTAANNDTGTSFVPKVECTGSDIQSFPLCIFTTNMREEQGLPEILAVDVQPAARDDVHQCLEYVAYCMVNSKMVVPDRYRFTLQFQNHQVYFACLQATTKLDVLYDSYMEEPRPASADMVIVLMPIGRSLLWGHLPQAPDKKTRMRDHIKAVLEERMASPEGFVRFVDGKAKNVHHSNLARVSLEEALSNDDWEIDWEGNTSQKCREVKRQGGEAQLYLQKRRGEVEYLQMHAAHFRELLVDCIGAERSTFYISQVCDKGSHWTDLYQEGKLIVSCCADDMELD
ncbi:expressed unknown protein [Seminavis robusta]|uniref:Uncharacterized protein n=1 Tax=Seminavis robusta TaxID=568900 RepID=A0A9N8F1D1_9STRA|nr:expressed unknown protein [Seminavis robusta]|eukprot:Sro2563_g331370.1 n/a (298) ;mRNA; r:7305-8198